MLAIRLTIWTAILGRSTTPRKAVYKSFVTVQTTCESPPSFSRSPVENMEEVGPLELKETRLIQVSLHNIFSQMRLTDYPDIPSRVSTIFYFGLEGLGGLEMETDENENVNQPLDHCLILLSKL